MNLKIKTINNVIRFSIMLFALFFFQNQIIAQLTLEWERNYGGSEDETLQAMQQTTDGGYILAGSSRSNDGDVNANNGGLDFWILKLDTLENIEWEKNYGGSSSDVALTIKQTIDGGYIVGGYSNSTNGDFGINYGKTDCWILKLDTNGNLEWKKNYGGSEGDQAIITFQTTDGGYLVFANTRSIDGDIDENNGLTDCWILKLDTNGELEWEKNYGGSWNDSIMDVKKTIDGGYIVASTSDSFNGDVGGNNGDSDFWVLKLDANGDLEWEKNYGGTSSDGSRTIQVTTDGGYILAGGTFSDDGDVTSNNGSEDIWIIKLDSNGNLEWEKNYGGLFLDVAHSIQQTTDNGYLVLGRTNSSDGDVGNSYGGYDYWLLKLEENGNLEWEKNYGGSWDENPTNILITSENGIIIGGHSNSHDELISNNIGGLDFWIIKFEELSAGVLFNKVIPQIAISPNPSNGNFILQLDSFSSPADIKIYNHLGSVIYSKDNIRNTLEINGIPKGHYYANIICDKFNTSKIIIIH